MIVKIHLQRTETSKIMTRRTGQNFMRNITHAQINDVADWEIYELGSKQVSVCMCVCTCFYHHEIRKCKNVISPYYEKNVVNCIFSCFLLATKFAVILCLKYQRFLRLQMAIQTYKNILRKIKAKLKI